MLTTAQVIDFNGILIVELGLWTTTVSSLGEVTVIACAQVSGSVFTRFPLALIWRSFDLLDLETTRLSFI